jgi:hypothetical protein
VVNKINGKINTAPKTINLESFKKAGKTKLKTKIKEAISIRKYNESIENERVKSYLISLNYLSVEIIQLIKLGE